LRELDLCEMANADSASTSLTATHSRRAVGVHRYSETKF
jgi:hypothetical protein